MNGISISDWRAIGPTPQALQIDDLPTKSSQLRSVQKAVIKGQDVSLGGMIPLTAEQIVSLEELATCSWKILSNTPSLARTALALCPDRQKSVTLYYDELDRVTSVKIEQGSIVRRPAY